ncbi:Alpha/beta hydrolase family protein [Parasphingorhabdus marina DSM 22363]|uniref:Palmitoyl-protein thioesterase ABHD10, mitochondrial n=1 Tax=Parasphingorhabdus marina DSM 22363 TaxID=1123272 RepID=A0A1N6DD52_9SPHN|nr:alpha/beta hydrolase [Parasphingorhabdus marina]SIN68728.1 Alpha/beta hydrolase family protein [Parasphingorhabdus marina DSM 22363]
MEEDILYLDRPGGTSLAHCYTPPKPGVTGTTLVFLPGYMSDMEGGKALALDSWAKEQGRAILRLDYAGCGASGGEFEDQSLVDWRDDVLFLIDKVTEGAITLVGSSMGGWLMLLVALSRPMRVKNLVGIAAAPDFTDWGFSQDQKMTILRDGKLEEDSEYSDEPYVTTRTFWQSGEANRLLQKVIAFDGAVRLLHGQNDADVPWMYSLEIAKQMRSADVQVHLVKDGDHRLSRDQDIALLIDIVARLP